MTTYARLNKAIVENTIKRHGYRYQVSTSDQVFLGCPVSQVPTLLRQDGWRNVPKVDSYDLQKLGLRVANARYVGGARPKKYVVAVLIGEAL